MALKKNPVLPVAAGIKLGTEEREGGKLNIFIFTSLCAGF